MSSVPVEDYPTFSRREPIDTLQDGEDYSSTNVHSLLYDFGERELIARYYRDGADAVYRYPGFPANEWQALADASSKGGYINRNIREQYRFDRLRIADSPSRVTASTPRARRFLTAPISTS